MCGSTSLAREEGGRGRDRGPAPAPRCHRRHGAWHGFVLQPWTVRVCPDNRATGAQCPLAALGMENAVPRPAPPRLLLSAYGISAAASESGSAQGAEHGRPCHGQRGGPGCRPRVRERERERGVGGRGGVVGPHPQDCEGPCCAQCQPLCTHTG